MMLRLAVLSAAAALALAGNGPLEACTEERMYVADQEDLCRFHWCNGDGSTLMMACAPGTRVPTWYRFTLAAGATNPCTQFHVSSTKCLRCEIPDDESDPQDPNDCLIDRCGDGCTCQDLWQAYYCLCPDNEGFISPGPVVTPGIDYCLPDDPCQNGATCYSQWDDYWCKCPPGYTGKNCDVPFCSDPNPCENGGTCTIDRITYHCECTPQWTGICCRDPLGGTRPAVVTTPTTTTTAAPPSDDEQYTMTFSDASGCGGNKYVYVTPNVSPLDFSENARSRTVRIYTPGLQPSNRCYVDFEEDVTDKKPLMYDLTSDLPADCLQTTATGEVTSGAALRVAEIRGRAITVTAAPCDYDGFLAIKDKEAGLNFMAGPMNYGNYFTILALVDCTVTFNLRGRSDSYSMRQFQTLRIAATDLAEAYISSDGLINVWSGDIHLTGADEFIEYENIEQNIGTHAWGQKDDDLSHYYFIGGIERPARIQGKISSNWISMQAFRSADYRFYNWTGSSWNLVQSGIASAQSYTILPTEFDDFQWLVVSERAPVQIIHEANEFVIQTANFDDYIASATAQIPSERLYDRFFSFQIHGSGFNSYEKHYVMINVPEEEADSITIEHVGADGVSKFNSVRDLQGVWNKSMVVDRTQFVWARIELNARGFWYFTSLGAEFSAIYYGMTAGGIGGSVAFPIKFAEFAQIVPGTECKACEIDVEQSDGTFVCVKDLGSCNCNPCDGFDDICVNQHHPTPRNCTKKVDSSGNRASIVFMHNSEEDDENREHEIYVTSAATMVQTVRVSTPYISVGNRCHINETFRLQPATTYRFSVPNTDCTEMKFSSLKFVDKLIRVESVELRDILVYAVNREKWSTDGWLALPDNTAAMDFYVICYNPPQTATQFAVLALEDDTRITITHNGRVTPDNPRTEFILNAGETSQLQAMSIILSNGQPDFSVDKDLSGTRVQSNKKIHVWSGNQRALVCDEDQCKYTGSRDHLVEQAIPVDAWGQEYNVVPVPGRVIGDFIKVLAQSEDTEVTVEGSDGYSNTTTLNAGEFFTFDAFSDIAYRVVGSKKIMVAQITKSRLSRGLTEKDDLWETINDPSMTYVPPVAQYTNRYRFITPSFSGGASGDKRPYNTSYILISAHKDVALGITYTIRDPSSGQFLNEVSAMQNLSGSRGQIDAEGSLAQEGWIKVPGSDYWNKAIRISHGVVSVIHPDFQASFMCLYYGADDRESIGFNVGMTLAILSEIEN